MRSNKGNDVGMTIPNQLGQDQHHPVALFAHLPFYSHAECKNLFGLGKLQPWLGY